jgi:hypothetical protein
MAKVGMPKGKASKWPTSEQRRKACESYCDHIKAGFSKDSWPDADFETVQRYMKDFPEDFCPQKVKEAERFSRKFWEEIGIDGTVGKIKGFNAKSWEFNMQNRLGWSNRVDNTHKDLTPTIIKDDIPKDE